MKHLLFICLFLCFGFNKLNAQDISYGLRVAPNFTNLSGSDAKGLSGKTGISAAFIYKFYISDFVDIETGFGYSTWGANGTADSLDIKLGYMEWPIIFKYNVYYGLTIEAGIESGLLVNSKYGNEEESYGEFFKLFDTRYVAGLSYQTESGFTAGILYKAGFTSIGSESEDYSSGTPTTIPALDLKNNAIQISLGYFFE